MSVSAQSGVAHGPSRRPVDDPTSPDFAPDPQTNPGHMHTYPKSLVNAGVYSSGGALSGLITALVDLGFISS